METTATGQRIHVLESDAQQRALLCVNLRMAGYLVSESADVWQARARMSSPGSACELLLMDWHVANMDAIEFLRQLRADHRGAGVPAVVVSHRAEEADKLAAFNAGADEYLSRPFGMRELLARVASVLRRSEPPPKDRPIEFDGLRLDAATRSVLVGANKLALSQSEFRLLRLLMLRPWHVHSRDRLLDEGWPGSVVAERTVDAAIARLRAAFARAGHYPCIQTVRAVGYRLVSRAEAVLDA